MKTSTKIILILFALTSVPTVVLFPNLLSAFVFGDNGIELNFSILSYVTLALLVLSVIFSFVLYFRFLYTLSINKVLFFSTLPFTLIYAALLFFVSSLSNLDNNFAKTVKTFLNIQENNQYNTILWAILLTIIYVLVLFVVYLFVTKPIFKMEKLLERLGDGKIKEKKFNLGGGKQFKEIGHSLLKINNNYKNINENNFLDIKSKSFPKNLKNLFNEDMALSLNQGRNAYKKAVMLVCKLEEDIDNVSLINNYNVLDLYLNIVSPLIKRFNGYLDETSNNYVCGVFAKSEDGLDCAHAIYRALKIKAKHNRKIKIKTYISVHLLQVEFSKNKDGKVVLLDKSKVLNEKIVDFAKLLNSNLIFTKDILDTLPLNYFLKYRYIGKLDFENQLNLFESFEIFGKSKKELIAHSKQSFEKAVMFFNQGLFDRAKIIFEDILRYNSNDKASFVYLNKCNHTN